MRAPFAVQRRPAKLVPSTIVFDIGSERDRISRLLTSLEESKATHDAEHTALIDKNKKEHATAMAKIDAYLQAVVQYVNSLKAPHPIAGVDYPIPTNGVSPDAEAIKEKVLAQIPPPEKVTVDYKKAAKMAAELVPPAKVEKVDHEKLAGLVLEKIKKDKSLTTEHIGNFTDGLEQTIRPIRSLVAGVRGGGDTVAAGSNVTITTSNGVKTISAASGGGFTTLTATETPNGVITVFTFAAAVAQPSFVIVDNVWQRATTKSGTVNWTWAAGPKQITLTVPAQDEILGIV